MKLVKMRQDTAEPEPVSLVELGGSSKTSRLLNLSRMLSSWRDRIWPLLLVVLLVILFVPYLRVALTMSRRVHASFNGVPLSPLLVIGVLFLVLFSLFRPTWALALFFAVAPLANGLVAWVILGDPALHQKAGMFWVEPLFLSLAIGLLLRQVFWTEPTNSKWLDASVGFYAAVVLTSMALFFLQSPWWWERLTLAWLHIPRMRQLSPNHPLRAGLLILASLLCYRLTLNRLRTSGEIRLACRGWLVGASLAGFYGLSAWATQWGQYAQVGSLLEDVNAYGSYLVLTLFIAWGEWLTEKGWWARAVAGLVILLTILMIPLAGSRIAMIAAMAGAGIAWITLAKSVKWGWLRGGVLAALGGGILLFSLAGGYGLIDRAFQAHPKLVSLGLARVAQAADARLVLDVWRDSRQGLAAAGIRMVEENPVFGLGPGTAYRELGLGDYLNPDDKRYTISGHENLHNYFVQVAAETGLLGLAGFLWIVLAALAGGFSRDLGKERLLARFFSIGVGAYLITAFTSHPLILSRQALLFWGCLGILVASSRVGKATIGAASNNHFFRFMP